MVRQRNRPGQGPGKAKRSLCRKDSSGSMSEIPPGKDEGLCSPFFLCIFVLLLYSLLYKLSVFFFFFFNL